MYYLQLALSCSLVHAIKVYTSTGSNTQNVGSKLLLDNSDVICPVLVMPSMPESFDASALKLDSMEAPYSLIDIDSICHYTTNVRDSSDIDGSDTTFISQTFSKDVVNAFIAMHPNGYSIINNHQDDNTKFARQSSGLYKRQNQNITIANAQERYFDSRAFVSVPLLAGFMCTLIVIVITLIGLCWLVDIQTPTQFEKPMKVKRQ